MINKKLHFWSLVLKIPISLHKIIQRSRKPRIVSFYTARVSVTYSLPETQLGLHSSTAAYLPRYFFCNSEVTGRISVQNNALNAQFWFQPNTPAHLASHLEHLLFARLLCCYKSTSPGCTQPPGISRSGQMKSNNSKLGLKPMQS